MTLDAGAITAFQQCPRKWLLNQSDEVRRWRPRSLFLRQVRQVIEGLSIEAAVSELFEIAREPGIDTQFDPFTVARNLASMVKTAGTCIQAGVTRGLARLPVIVLGAEMKWSCNALFDGERLHSWATVDSASQPSLVRELHSWYVVGDCACSGLPMTLHLIKIGNQPPGGRGRFSSPWCRVYAHPIVVNRWAFQQKNGRPLQGKWKPIYFEDGDNDVQTWLELMRRDNVKAIEEISVKQLSVEQANRVKDEIMFEACRMDALQNRPWPEQPMRRTACDVPVCGWQPICFQ